MTLMIDNVLQNILYFDLKSNTCLCKKYYSINKSHSTK